MFLLGMAMVALGFVFVSKTEFMINNFGRIGFFEVYLSTAGGSRIGYKFVGIVLIFFGTLIFTGLIDPFLGWILGPLIKRMLPPGNI
jgi:hypothetical protein